MKQTTVTIVTREDFVEHLLGIVQKNHKTTKNGNKLGGIRTTAAECEVPEGTISSALNSGQSPNRKLLAHFGLMPKTVYVKQEDADNG